MSNKGLFAGAAAGGLLAISIVAGSWTIGHAEPTDGRVGEPPAAGAPASFADIVARVAPAVVSIDVEGKASRAPAAFSGQIPFGSGGNGGGAPDFHQFFGQQAPDDQPAPKMEATGSGFFISADGYIVTNNHVVENADKITVRTSDDRTLTAKLVGRDPATDLAVIKVEGSGYAFVDFENRAKPRVGDWVIAVGNPFNLGGSATAGIVSALARPHVSGSNYVDYMQIDAPINRGNSGGPTFDVYGRVVGVNTAIFSPSGGSVGIGFDIPADIAQSISQQLIASGKVTRGYIGATIQDVTPEIAESMGVSAHQGALVADVTPDGPSATAGLKSGDLILQVDDHAITSASDLTRQVALARQGEALRLKVRRDGAIREIAVRSGVRPSETMLARNDAGGGGGGADDEGKILGMRLAANPEGGVTIEGVSSDSDASDKGLQRGDVIVRAGDQKTDSPADLSAAVAAARHDGRKAVLLLVKHGGRRLFVPLEVTEADG
ncbi:MAG: Do family serine endopeptidase [Caulobacteraceae bacterium]|nr:Do family serine endopeptidase [Caulobacteraceae bacterium]